MVQITVQPSYLCNYSSDKLIFIIIELLDNCFEQEFW